MSESTGNSIIVNEPLKEQDRAPMFPQACEVPGEPPVKHVPVSEAIRYRKRAQAAEKELDELKQAHEKQAEELAGMKDEVEQLKAAVLNDPSLQSNAVKTQGVKESRTSGVRTMLQNAARQAADSGSRADMQEYLRLRRNYL